MGYFGQWLVAKGVDAPTLREWGLEPWGEGAARGWLFARTQDPSRLADHVAKASAEGGAAVGAAVFDSDFAYVVAARDGVQAAEVAVNLESAQSYDVDLPSYPDAFARWTQVAPRALTGDEVRDILSKNWVLAEEGVQELFERAGLPQPYDPGKPADLPTRDRPSPATVESVNAGGLGGYQSTFGWMRDAYRVAGEDLPWADARYVPGVGADFLGIWDREDPLMPAFRFPRTSRGESQLEAELERLRRPLELRKLELDGLGGFRECLGWSDPHYRLIGRALPLQEARFVAGHGDGFVGVWDRERPAEPIERFGRGERGELRASGVVHRLMFERELGRKQLSGCRLVHPRRPAKDSYSAPAGPWLITEEDEDERWPASTLWGGGPFHLYVFTTPPNVESVFCEGSFATLEDAQQLARREGADLDWSQILDDVARDLLSTVTWVVRDECL